MAESTHPHLSDESLAAMAEGELEGIQLSEAAAHVEGCPRCQEELAQFKSLLLEFRNLPLEVAPPGFAERVMGEVEKLEASWWRLPFWRTLLSPRRNQGMVVALLGVAVALFVLRTPEMEDASKLVGVPSSDLPAPASEIDTLLSPEPKRVALPPSAELERSSASARRDEMDGDVSGAEKKEKPLDRGVLQDKAVTLPESRAAKAVLDMAPPQEDEALDQKRARSSGLAGGGGGVAQNTLGSGRGLVGAGTSGGGPGAGFAYAPVPPDDMRQQGYVGSREAEGQLAPAEPASQAAVLSADAASEVPAGTKNKGAEAQLNEETSLERQRKWPTSKSAPAPASSPAKEQLAARGASAGAAAPTSTDASEVDGTDKLTQLSKDDQASPPAWQWQLTPPPGLGQVYG